VRWINSIKYDTRSKLARVSVPVLVMHSREDQLIRFHHAEKNFAAANEPKLFCELSGPHNDAVWEQGEFQEAIEALLKLAAEPAKSPYSP
jgi:pimeloyl-ACP methyl ester carboxylesterase